MTAASILLVLVLAKLLALPAHHDLWSSFWGPIAYFWQDAAVALAFALTRSVFARTPRRLLPLYVLVTMYVAINVAVVRVLSTPLTWAMWRAARGPLADSIAYYARPANISAVLIVAGAAGAAPRLLRWVPERALVPLLAACVSLGPAAASRIDTRGGDRNAWTALAATATPRLSARRPNDWRRDGFAAAPGDDLARFRGTAAGQNVVLVALESTAAPYLGLYGGRADVMPNLERLARSAITFESAYAVYPESIKGLYSVLCSSYPAFDVPISAYENAPCAPLPKVLAEKGYATALFHSGRFMYLGMDEIVRHRGYDLLADAGDVGGNHRSSFGIDEPATVARILQWIDARPSGQPFFVTYLPIAGHHPYATSSPGPFADSEEFGRYENALHEGDEALGALVDGLGSRGLATRTMWIVFGDHGEAFGQHEGNYGHTFNLYEENVHVPMIAAIPGATRQVRSKRIVSLVDVAPTVLDLMGVPAPSGYQGASMLAPGARMSLFFADYSLGLLGLRDGDRKVIYALDSNRSQLFDLAADPHERVNLADRDPERLRWYVKNLRGWSTAQKQRLTAPMHAPADFRAAVR